jgi:hypothetical protein
MGADESSTSGPEPGGRLVERQPFKLGRDAPSKLAARRISEHEVRAPLADHVIIDVVEHRTRYVLLGRVPGPALIAVLAQDDLDDATVLISAYEPDVEHGWTPGSIDRTLRGEGPEEAPR